MKYIRFLKRATENIAVLLASVVTVLAVMPTGCRTPDEPGYAELQAGKAAFRAKDYDSAVAHFRPAAEQGNATAQVLLGFCYREGEGIGQDDFEAAKWFRAASDQLFGAGELYLGHCYH